MCFTFQEDDEVLVSLILNVYFALAQERTIDMYNNPDFIIKYL